MLPLPLLLLLGAFSVSTAHSPTPDQPLVSVRPGKGPLVISVPHDGTVKPAEIPDRRRYGCQLTLHDGTTVCDWSRTCQNVGRCQALLGGDPNTAEIAEHVVKTLNEDGLWPHLIVNRLHRVKMDPNRGGERLDEAAQNNSLAEAVYREYHAQLSAAKNVVRSRFGGRGLLIDLHGQHHRQNWTEFGYLLTSAQLNNGSHPPHECSIRALISRSGQPAASLISGSHSLGALLSGLGYRSVPSESIPGPHGGGYYRGGFITQHYGSVLEGEFDAVQVEVTQAVMYASRRLRRRFGKRLATAIGVFVRKFYF